MTTTARPLVRGVPNGQQCEYSGSDRTLCSANDLPGAADGFLHTRSSVQSIPSIDVDEAACVARWHDWNQPIILVGLTRAEIVDEVRKSRAMQGLPPRIEDPAVLARMGTIANDCRLVDRDNDPVRHAS